MSRNRKILNLFKFVDEIYNILRTSNDPTKDISLRFFGIMTHIGAFFHFLLDNIIWLTNTGVLGRFRLKQASDAFVKRTKDFKYFKYVASMWRNVSNLIYSYVELQEFEKYVRFLSHRKLEECKFKMMCHPDEPVGNTKDSFDNITELLSTRFKKRITQLEIFHCVLRLIMAWDSLELP